MKILVKPGQKVRIAEHDAGNTSEVRGGKAKAEEGQEAIRLDLEELQELLAAERKHRILIVLQGMDTSGKDGTIRYLMDGFNAAGVRVATFKKPTQPELDHDFLWRVHAQVPGNGEIVIFNRSHYEDVLIVRVHDLVPKAVWQARFQQINDFERMLSESGTTILKFFLHISPEEQKERLQARIDDPEKRWKLNRGDIEERKLWPEYMRAYEEMLEKTSTDTAPWHIVPADKKWYRNQAVGTRVVKALRALDMKFPEVDLSDVSLT